MEDFLKAGREFSFPMIALSATMVAFFVAEPAWAQDMPKDAEHILFRVSDRCMSCHNGMVSQGGEDLSIGFEWRASMMANAARDPYWHAAVRREVMDHPSASAAIQNECSTCHMPMARHEAALAGRDLSVFAHLPTRPPTTRADSLAADGVSCTMCHQITDRNLGTRESFVGGFDVDTATPWGSRTVFGPSQVDEGRKSVMASAASFQPAEGLHLRSSELCATCHTLYTHSLGPDGEVVGELPEQVPYLEWQHSDYPGRETCQTCHMPVVRDSVAVSSVLGIPRTEVSRHVFRGGNSFMMRILNRYRDELGVRARPEEFTAAIRQTEDHLATRSARIRIQDVGVSERLLRAEVQIENLAGHKLPTAYPSRRAWIHFVVRDRHGDIVFESGSLRPGGRIVGNDNDDDPTRFEPHHREITQSDQVQIYEAILQDPNGRITTGLLTAVGFAKDSRILPTGFDKESAHADVAVHGEAREDSNFVGGSDRIRYVVEVAGRDGPFMIRAELWYQSVGYRWARNLAEYDAEETNRFVRYYDSMTGVTGVILAETRTTVDPDR